MESSQNTPVSETKPVKKPKLWRYALAFLVLVLFWVVALELWIRPGFLTIPGVAIAKRLGLYLVPPLLAVLAVYTLRVAYVRRKLGQREEQAIEARLKEDAQRREVAAGQAAILVQKRFALEILSLGMVVEYLRHEQVWEELQSQKGNDPILSSDSENYPSALNDKEKSYRERETEVLDRALGWLTAEWAIPTFLAGPALHNPQMRDVLESNLTEALGYGEPPGRRLKVVASIHDETPDLLLQRVFDFMDKYNEVPAVLLVAEDGLALRECLRAGDSPELLREGPRPQDAIIESVVAILLGRKDRLAAMRAFTQSDSAGEDALKPFWERDLAARSASAFTTSEWLPGAWSKALLEGFSKLPVIGLLHRPQFMHFQGQGDASRADSLKEAWETALESLEEGGKNKHLFYDFGAVTQGTRLRPLARAMVALDPDFDVFDQGVNLHRRIGDTGAACPYLGMALAAMASFRERGVSTSVFLRREEGASLFMISPSLEIDGQAEKDPFEDAGELV